MKLQPIAALPLVLALAAPSAAQRRGRQGDAPNPQSGPGGGSMSIQGGPASQSADGVNVAHGRRDMSVPETPPEPNDRHAPGSPPAGGDASDDGAAPAPEAGADTAGKEDAAPAEMSEGDAKVNFPTVVESYLAEHSPKGYFAVTDKQTRLTWRLKLDAIDLTTLKSAGTNRYSARAGFKDVRNGKRLSIDFTVDFSGSEWKVRDLKIARKAPRQSDR